MFDIIFSNFWTWLGTLVIVFSFGYAMSLPFYWYARTLEQSRLLQEESKTYKFYESRN